MVFSYSSRDRVRCLVPDVLRVDKDTKAMILDIGTWGTAEAVAYTILIAIAVALYLWQAGKYNG